MRLVSLIAALLLAAACAAPRVPTEPPSAPPPISVELADFEIRPDQLSTAAGAVSINVTSAGPTPHNLTIRDAAGAVVIGSDELSTGESDVLETELDPGEYTMFCALPGHESLGMRGTLSVTQ